MRYILTAMKDPQGKAGERSWNFETEREAILKANQLVRFGWSGVHIWDTWERREVNFI